LILVVEVEAQASGYCLWPRISSLGLTSFERLSMADAVLARFLRRVGVSVDRVSYKDASAKQT
jgi:hypothetical protein